MKKLPVDITLDGLRRTGWEVESVDNSDLDWWADEIWHLRSVWQPRCLVYLTFLVDQDWQGVRRKGERVRSVMVSRKAVARYYGEGSEADLYLGRHTASQLQTFLDKLAMLRESLREITLDI